MKLTYQTAVATLIQFITMTLLGIPNTLISVIGTCHNDSSNCVSNLIVSLIVFILTAVWFAFIWVVGYFAQERRSKLLAWLLMGAELGTIGIAGYINLPHDGNILAKITSLLDVLLGLWIMLLAFRLIRSKGGRIVSSHRHRRHLSKDYPGPDL